MIIYIVPQAVESTIGLGQIFWSIWGMYDTQRLANAGIVIFITEISMIFICLSHFCIVFVSEYKISFKSKWAHYFSFALAMLFLRWWCRLFCTRPTHYFGFVFILLANSENDPYLDISLSFKHVIWAKQSFFLLPRDVC